jgi:uncharacterized membrane protein
MSAKAKYLVAAVAASVALLAGCQQQGADKAAIADAGGASTAVVPDKPLAESLGAPAPSDVKPFFEGEFEAFGAEPDWKLSLLGRVAQFERPGLDDVQGFPNPADVRMNGALIDAEPLTIIMKATACQFGGAADGQAPAEGSQLPYTVSVFYEGVTYQGCGRRATEGGITPGWAAAIAQFLPAIDQCLARVSAKPGRVTIAYVNESAAETVRLVDDNGGRYECTANTDGTFDFTPIGDRDVLRGERDPLFSRTPTEPPKGKCYSSEPALGASGEPVGTLTRRTC